MSETEKHQKSVKEWTQPFLEAFAEYGTVTHACRAAGVSRATVYRHREDHPEFAEQWAAVEDGVSSAS